MDTFFRGLIAVFIVVCAGGFSSPVFAQDCQPLSYYMAQCQAAIAGAPRESSGYTFTWTCDVVSGGGPGTNVDIQETGKRSDGLPIDYGHVKGLVCDAPPANPCDGLKAKTYNQAGKVLSGTNACIPQDQPDGSSVKCGFTFTPSNAPAQNQWGSWSTYGTLAPSGDVCGAGQGTGAGAGWQDDGKAPVQPPTPPPQDGPDKKPAPKLCGELSCYKPDTGEYCTTGSSGEICTKGAAPGASSGGSCASGGDTTICAGTPQAPKPPESKVPDPPTQTKGTDNYQSADPATGDVRNVSVGAYSGGPGTVSSGATSGDTKPPAPASSSTSATPPDTSDKTSASGGGDCNNAPSVSGSPALAMVATQAWQTRCATDKVHQDLAGDGKTSPGDIGASSGTSAFVDVPSSGNASADAANKGVYDQAGMGFATTCPIRDLDVPLWDGKSFSIAMSKACPIGDWIRMIVIGMALFGAAVITAGGKS